MAQISLNPAPYMQQIDLNSLNVQQLTTLKQQLDQELNMFQESLQALKLAQSKFQKSAENIEKITPDTEGRPILVPLTGSMYVPGKLINTKRFIIDIGTRYYAEKDADEAKDYFKRKVAFVTHQMEKIQALGLEKSRIRDAVCEVILLKIKRNKQAAEKN